MIVSEFELFVQRLINKGLDNTDVTRKTLMSIAKNECELSDSDAYKFVKKVSNSATPTSTRGSYILNLQRTTKVRKTKKTKMQKALEKISRALEKKGEYRTKGSLEATAIWRLKEQFPNLKIIQIEYGWSRRDIQFGGRRITFDGFLHPWTRPVADEESKMGSEK